MGTRETNNSGKPRIAATPLHAGSGARADRSERAVVACPRRHRRALRPLVLTVALALAGVAVPASSAAARALTIDKPEDGAAFVEPTPSFTGTTNGSSELFGELGEPRPVTLRIYAGASASGSPVQKLATTISEPEWSAVAGTLAPGMYTAVAEQDSGIEPLSEPEFSNSVTFLIEEAPHVTAQPSDRVVDAGGTARFEASADGIPAPAVQWEVSTDGGADWHADTNDSGAGSETLTVSAATASQNGNEYRAAFTNGAGRAVSQAARLEVLTAPEVTSSPVDVVAVAGSPATFTAAATGRPEPTVQWQVSKDGGVTWSSDPDSSARSTTLTIAAVASSQNGNEYRAVFTNSAGSASSLPATLEVQAAPAITTNPSSHGVNEGEAATFTAAASGNPVPTVQWQVSTDFGGTWEVDTTDAGATTPKLTISATTSDQNGNEYRAVFSNPLGSVISSPATLTVHEPRIAPSITSSPVNRSVLAGESAVFTASASGTPTPTVEWEVSIDKGSTWHRDTSDTGATSKTLVVESAALTQSGYEYRALFSNSVGSVKTSAATLTVNVHPEAPKVTKQPVSVEKAVGETATFTAAASGVPTPSVQWQMLPPGGSWTDDRIDPGNATLQLTVPTAAASLNGTEYRAVFSNASGRVETASARLTVQTPPAITLNPVSTTAAEGEEAAFTAAATGVPFPHVQWEALKNGASSFVPIKGATSPELVLPSVNESENGLQVRAVFTNTIAGVVKTAVTKAATLTVTNAPAIKASPADTGVVAGTPATFTASGSGSPAPEDVEWQVRGEGSGKWLKDTEDAVTVKVTETLVTTTLDVAAATPADNGNEYRAVFRRPAGKVEPAVSAPARLEVYVAPAATVEPADDTVSPGETASFSAAASGTPAPSVKWQLSTDGGASWSQIEGAESNTLAVPGVTSADSGHLFRAVFENLAGQMVTRAALLTVLAPAGPPPVAPSASFTWFPSAPQVGQTVTLASTSTDPSSPITGFAWDPQGTNAFEPGPSVITTVFKTAGHHTVNLRVSDGNGQASVATEDVFVSAVKLGLLQPFPVVRIAGTDSHAGARISLLAVQAPVGAHVLVSCVGRGCPRAHEARTATAGKTKRSVVLFTFRRFERSLRAGIKLEVKVYAPGLIGKYTSFRIRHSKLPARVDACLDPRTLKAMTCPT